MAVNGGGAGSGSGASLPNPSTASRLTPVDLLTLAYLAATLPLFALLPDRGDALVRSALHVALIAVILVVRRTRLITWGWGRVVLDLYPVLLFGYFYGEAAVLNRAFHPTRYFDPLIIGWEQALFGAQPARDFRDAVPWKALGEYLHLAYFSYYSFVGALVLTLLFQGRRREMRISLGTLALSYYLGFVVFILLPVRGPYYEFTRALPADVGYFMPGIVHWVLDRGSAVGTAFPSSHVSISITVWIMAMRYQRPLAVILLFLVPGMAAGAVYGGFHFLIDILAGATLGVLCSTAGHRWVARTVDRR